MRNSGRSPIETRSVTRVRIVHNLAMESCRARSMARPFSPDGLEKWLANLWGMNRIAKKADAVRGQEVKWEIPVDNRFCEKGLEISDAKKI
jgi:hypothetical protein